VKKEEKQASMRVPLRRIDKSDVLYRSLESRGFKEKRRRC